MSYKSNEEKIRQTLKQALFASEITGAMAIGQLECMGYSSTTARALVQKWKLDYDTTPSANKVHAGGIPEMGVTE